MNALTRNVVMCAYPGDCCQPGTVAVVIGTRKGVVVLEFCEAHHEHARRRWGG